MIPFAFDTETHLITDDEPSPKIVCLSYAMGEASGVLAPGPGLELLAQCLADPEIEIVGHNLAFDFRVCLRAWPELEPLVWAAYDAGRVYDTKIAAWLDDIARGTFEGSRKGAYTLATLVSKYMGDHLEKGEDTWRLRYAELDDIPIEQWPAEAVEYARLDAAMALAVRGEIRTTGGETPDLRRQCAHDWWLSLVGTHGIATDAARVGAMFERVTDRAAELARELVGLGWVSFDKDGIHRHPSRVQARVWEILGEGCKRTKGGGVSADAESCEATGDPALLKYALLTRLLDLISKDSEYLTKPLVRCSYGLAESGRSTSYGPNVQNLKTDPFSEKGEHPILGVRECLVPRPGYVFAGADYDGLELRTMAQVCKTVLGTSKLAESLNSGTDPHAIVASELLGTPYDEIKATLKIPDHPDYAKVYRGRQCGKVANFGFPGGLGFKRLIEQARGPKYGVQLDEAEARRLKDIWLSAHPEFREYFLWINDLVHSGQPCEQLFSGRLRGGASYTELANTMFQGLGADATKAAGYALTKACRGSTGPLAGSHPIVYVHDEFWIEVPEDRAEAAAEEMARVMVEAAGVFLPDVPPKAEPFLARRWSKSAKRTIVDGRLVPWDG